MIETVLHDVRLALRLMRRSPGFTAAVVLTMGVAIGLNTAVFSVLDAAVLRPLPFPEGDRLVTFHNLYPKLNDAVRGQNSIPDYYDRLELRDVLESLALVVPETRNVVVGTAPMSTATWRVTPAIFEVLRVRPALGRLFAPEEEEPGRSHVAVLGHGLWQRAFGGSRSAIGGTVRIDGVQYQVVGVMPRGFRLLHREAEMLLPLAPTPEQRGDMARHGNVAEMIGRLRPGVSVQAVQARVDALSAAVLQRLPDLGAFVARSGYRTAVRGLREVMVEDFRAVLLMLQAGTLLVLVIGCANVSNLLLIRAHGRLAELAVRASLGASRSRIARQLTTEGICLAALGTVLGLGIGAVLLLGLDAAVGGWVDALGAGVIRLPVVLFAVGLMLVSAIVFGALPALHLSGHRFEGLLRRLGRSGTDDRRATLARGALVVTEVALATVLAVCTGLLGVSLLRVNALSTGFQPAGVVAGRLALGQSAYPTDEAIQSFARRVVAVVAATPGVRHAAVTTVVPFSNDDNNSTLHAEGGALESTGTIPLPHQSWIAGDYFAALGIPLLEGRTFDDRDVASSMPVAIVDRVFADRNWPGQSALGRRVRYEDDASSPWLTVVGVVGTIKYHQLTEPFGHGSAYFPQTQPGGPLHLRRAMNLVVKADAGASALPPAIQAAVKRVDADLPFFDVRTMEERVSESLLLRRLPALLAAAFGGLGLALAMLGVYAVSAFGISQRLREIGIRMALGAPVVAMTCDVMRRGAWLVVVGLTIGLAAALATARLLAGVLHGVAPTDIGVLGTSLVIVLVTGLGTCAVTARRASRVDVAAMLRQE